MSTLEIEIFVAGFLAGSFFTWLATVGARTSELREPWKPSQPLTISPRVEQLATDITRKIEAIKVLRQKNPGIGLAEAKRQVEAIQENRRLAAGQALDTSMPGSQTINSHPGLAISDKVRRLAQDYRTKIQAIKVLRDENRGLGLAQAKEIIESMS